MQLVRLSPGSMVSCRSYGPFNKDVCPEISRSLSGNDLVAWSVSYVKRCTCNRMMNGQNRLYAGMYSRDLCNLLIATTNQCQQVERSKWTMQACTQGRTPMFTGSKCHHHRKVIRKVSGFVEISIGHYLSWGYHTVTCAPTNHVSSTLPWVYKQC